MLVLTDIYPAGENPIAGVTSQLIADAVTAQAGPRQSTYRNLKDVAPHLLAYCSRRSGADLRRRYCLDNRDGTCANTFTAGTGETGDRGLKETTDGQWMGGCCRSG